FLDDKNNDPLFFATVGALVKKKPESARAAILREIKEQDFTKAGNRIPDLVHLLSVYKDISLESFLLEKLQSADTYADYRSGILKYLAEMKNWSENLKTHVAKIFEDEAEPLTVRGSAAYALGKAGIDTAKPKLKAVLNKIEAMENGDEKKRYTRFRMQIIAGLILLKDDAVKEILFNMSRDDDEIVRLRAVRQIGALKIPDARPLLEYKSKFDPSVKIQREAKKALSHLDKDTPDDLPSEDK
ncbi:MAG TPA: HEAT repeat domain-containing protein, partial [Turneriella sp.]|nr:HEAT repeat domain-containing protein [Turneriella sp.]